MSDDQERMTADDAYQALTWLGSFTADEAYSALRSREEEIKKQSHFTTEEVTDLLDLHPVRGQAPTLVVVDEVSHFLGDAEFSGDAAGRGGRPRPRRKPESEIVLEGINYLRTRGYARKVHGGAMGNAGEPDVDACVNGRAIKLEAKAGSNTPSPTQLAALRRWAKTGALVGWFTTTEHIRQLLDHLDDENYETDLGAPGCTRSCHRETA